MAGEPPVLSVHNLRVSFFTEAGELRAVRDVSFSLTAGRTLALVGESGCGKSVTALAILRLLAAPGRITGGRIVFQGRDVLLLADAEVRELRGKSIGVVFQEPMSALNPVFSIGDQIGEVIRTHRRTPAASVHSEVLALLARVGIPAPAERIHHYPHQLSGGMKQRVMIAIALACRPALLIADEPTTALDVTVQAQILDLLQTLQAELGMAILLITHNLGVVAQFAQDVAVMYAGKIVERADVDTLFSDPLHPYTQALLRALPRPGHRDERLAAIAGMVPSPLHYQSGCAFAARCPSALARCVGEQPVLAPDGACHRVACWLHDGSPAEF